MSKMKCRRKIAGNNKNRGINCTLNIAEGLKGLFGGSKTRE